MSRPRYSFIFVNYQSAQWLEKSLESLRAAVRDIHHEILIVNNDLSETSALSAIAQKYQGEVIQPGANFGFGKANNIGAQRATGEVLFFLNPDTTFFSGSLRSLEAALQFSPQTLFGMRLLTREKEDEPWSKGRFPTLLNIFFGKLFSLGKKEQKNLQVERVDWVSGAALALRKETFEAIGGFDEHFFLYYEDVDLCFRAREKKFSVCTYPFLAFTHERGQSHATHREMKRAYFSAQRLYFEKHGAWIENKLLPILQPLYRFFFV